jgi:hypothetical protein
VGGRVQGQGSRGADHDEFFAPSVFELHAGDGKTWQKTMMNQGQKESNVTTMSQTTMSQTTMSQQCHNNVRISQQCHNNVTTMSQQCHNNVTNNNVQKTTIKTHNINLHASPSVISIRSKVSPERGCTTRTQDAHEAERE